MTEAIAVRRGVAGDVEPALLVWRAAGEARQGGRQASPVQGNRVRAHVENPDVFLFVAESVLQKSGFDTYRLPEGTPRIPLMYSLLARKTR